MTTIAKSIIDASNQFWLATLILDEKSQDELINCLLEYHARSAGNGVTAILPCDSCWITTAGNLPNSVNSFFREMLLPLHAAQEEGRV